MNREFFFFIAFLVLCTCAFGNYFDTGITTFHQGPPYTATFQGRFWGDEFESWRRTDGGYTFVSVYNNHKAYYYYAVLNDSGEFTPSSSLVGIDPPLPGAYLLDRSPSRKAQIDTLKQ